MEEEAGGKERKLQQTKDDKKQVLWGLKYGREKNKLWKLVRPGKFSMGQLSEKACMKSTGSWDSVSYLSKLSDLSKIPHCSGTNFPLYKRMGFSQVTF